MASCVFPYWFIFLVTVCHSWNLRLGIVHETGGEIPIIWDSEEEMFWGNLDGFARNNLLHICHGRRSSSSSACHSQHFFELLLPLPTGVRCIPRSTFARSSPCSRHVEKQSYNRNVDWMSVPAPALRMFSLRPFNFQMHRISIRATDKDEGDRDSLGH